MATETTLAAQGGSVGVAQENGKRKKLHGRAFYESIGSPKLVLAPMVEQSEFAWRLLSRSFLPESQQKNLLAYTPMFHSKMFGEKSNYRDAHFQPLKSTVPSPVDDYHCPSCATRIDTSTVTQPSTGLSLCNSAQTTPRTFCAPPNMWRHFAMRWI
ncbi:hypothetical protein P3342_006237 [Pyrenophora teres f. teres]|nr:hypothetical protein P3342_006237 [Pyrenophora teres f. teres]